MDCYKWPITMASEQTAIYLDSSSHAFKVARPVPLTTTAPKKPFKIKAVTINQTDSDKTFQKEKSSISPLWCSEEEDQASE